MDRSRRTLFDDDAELYDRGRPGHAEEPVAELIHTAGIGEYSTLLEVGIGTGHATPPFARTGAEIVAIDIGMRLLSVAARRLKDFPNVTFERGSFEEWEAPHGTYDLVYGAQVFHWMDPEDAVQRATGMLKPGGGISPIWTRVRDSTPDYLDIFRDAYRQHAPELAREDKRSWIDERLAIWRGVMAGSTMAFTEFHHQWGREYSAEEYLTLLGTFSDHRALPQERREALLTAIADAIQQKGGVLRIDYDTEVWYGRVRA